VPREADIVASWGAALRFGTADSQDESRCSAIHNQRPYHGRALNCCWWWVLGRVPLAEVVAGEASLARLCFSAHYRLLRKRRQAAALHMGLGVARFAMFACDSSSSLLL